MFRELLYVSIGLIIFAGIIFLFRTFDTSQGSLTGFAVRDSQQATQLKGNAILEQQQISDQNINNDTPNAQESQSSGASAEFQVAVRVVEP